MPGSLGQDNVNRRARRQNWSAGVVALFSVIVAFAATYGILTFRRNADQTRVGQVFLAQLESISDRQSVKESTVTGLGVASGPEPNMPLEREIDQLRADLSELRARGIDNLRQLSALPGSEGELYRVRRAFLEYQDVLDTQVALLDRGDFTQAFAFDRFRVGEAHFNLREALEDANREYSALARRAGLVADLGSFSVVVAAVLSLALLHERGRRQREGFEKELQHQAFHDGLTKLGNRLLFRERVEHALARSGRSGQPVAVLLLDLDGFKAINDTFGHEAGDSLLSDLADRLRDCTRTPDTVARLGGDEFAILLEDLKAPEDANEVAQRVTASIVLPFHVAGRSIQAGVSVGVAIAYPGDSISYDELLANADMAMYSAKLKGKGGSEIFGPSMRLAMTERLELAAGLKHAIEHDELVLHYQPIVDLRTNRIRGVEALVRWNHPERGLLGPEQFIPLAEDSGLIVPLGGWVVLTATEQLRRWQQEHPMDPPMRMSINLSAEEFQQKDLVRLLTQALAQSGIHPRTLILEITETALMKDTEATVERLRALKELGVLLAVDDFGTGYSSLSYLRRFPIDRLKIDRSFVANRAEDLAIIQTIIRLARSLELETVAEGIEEPDQLAELRALSCDFGQGNLFSPPSSAADMGRQLASRTPAGTLERMEDARLLTS